MNEKAETKKLLPPYLPYKTLSTFFDSLKVAVPSRIDRSIMRSMSGSMQSQLIGALEYLQLITPSDGVPTEKLQRFVHSEGPDRQKILKEILSAAYPFIFKDGFDLQHGTSHQLQELFVSAGTSGDTTRKCIAFFQKAAKDAGVTLSPYLKKHPGRAPGATKAKRKPKQQEERQLQVERSGILAGEEVSWEKLLLSKFPSFDPAWTNEVKVEWFKAFKDLRDMKTHSDDEKGEES